MSYFPMFPTFLESGDASRAPFWADPAGYLLRHQSAPAMMDPIGGISEADFGYLQQNVFPIQEKLLRQALDPNTVKTAVKQAETDVADQYAKAPAEFQTSLASQGVVASDSQKQAFNKQMALNQGIATAAAANRTRQAVTAQQAGILKGYSQP